METISIPGAEIYYDRNFLPADEATKLFDVLQAKCAWERRRTSFKSAVPRDEAYYGDPGTNYTYSRREYRPLAWIPELLALKARVEDATPAAAYTNLRLPKLSYNAVLCNLYRNGNDSVAGQTQKNFKHEVPKEPDVVRPRINLTFRRIEHK